MSAPPRNCYADQVFEVDVGIPAAATGVVGPPVLGAVTGIVARISATPNGAAINPAVDAMAALERAEKPGRFYVNVDRALLITYVLPLGRNQRFYVIWSKAGDFDAESAAYRVADRNDI